MIVLMLSYCYADEDDDDDSNNNDKIAESNLAINSGHLLAVLHKLI